MNYYRCSTEDLQLEAQRRGYASFGTRDQLGEALNRDDNDRGTGATTIKTERLGLFVPRELNMLHTAEFGETTPAMLLANERIVYWSMNSLFPTLQLFFESGRSCTIDGGRLPDAVVGLDPQLRFRLTDCTFEENGRMTRSMTPDKFAHSDRGILIKEAVVAQRTSVAMIPVKTEDDASMRSPPGMVLAQELHTVIGLKLEGMDKIGYIWAKSRIQSGCDNQTWGDVRIAGLRDDAPSPLLALPIYAIKPGGEVSLVAKESQIRSTPLVRGRRRISKPEPGGR
ncbi:hypothetical protein CC86DRAFT_134804 [Ophiobolus disseminans]|uniref:Uncharacterized protein n=1 Tax=Ophiobolus disseminans TaxID=1469910 RepID=A0A6A7AEL0_9PLEO|nr:hypothetical protein CC86DRAFT_134804 [Ophiobolus disseminans]